MIRILAILFFVVFPIASIIAIEKEIRFELKDGQNLVVSDLNFQNGNFQIQGNWIAQSEIKKVEFQEKEKTQTNSEKSKGVKEKISSEKWNFYKNEFENAEKTLKKYPGNGAVILLDEVNFQVKKEGNQITRINYSAYIAEENRKGMGDFSIYFDPDRERVDIFSGKTIFSDGTMRTLDLNQVKVSKPSGGDGYFGNGKILSFSLPEVSKGCIIEYSYQKEVFRPFDKNIWNMDNYFQLSDPIVLSRFIVNVPGDFPFYYKEFRFEGFQVTRNKSESLLIKTFIWEVNHIPPLLSEPLMPPYSDVVPRIVCSPFQDFSYLNEWTRNLLLKRIVVTKEIEDKVKDITRNSETVLKKIADCYHWVQKEIRYVSIKASMAAAWSGHPASETLANGYGDCTDKAVLFSCMMKTLGVSCEPISVLTNSSGKMVTEIGMMNANHCINYLEYQNKHYYLDCTADDYRFPAFRNDNHGAVCINEIRDTISEVDWGKPEDNAKLITNTIKLDKSGKMELGFQEEYTGSNEAGMRGAWRSFDDSDKERLVQDWLNSLSPQVENVKYSHHNPDDLTETFNIKIKGVFPDYLIHAGQWKIMKIPRLESAFSEFSLRSRKYKIHYQSPHQTRKEYLIQYPENWKIKTLPEPIHMDLPGITCILSFEEKKKGELRIHYLFSRTIKEILPKDYDFYREALMRFVSRTRDIIFFEAGEGEK